MSTLTTLLGLCHDREVTGYCPIGVQGTVLGIAVDLSAPPYSLRPFPGPYRAGVLGSLVPVGSECASWRKAVSRVLVHPQSETRVGIGSSAFGQAFRLERPSGGGLETEASAPVGEVGRSQKRAPFLLGQTFRSVIGSLFWTVV